jgi:hypothetical protein
MFAAKDTLLTRPSGAYRISRSVRLRLSASAYLNRTLTTPTNNKIWTWSAWVKIGILGTAANKTLFRAPGASPTNGIRFEGNDKLRIFFNDASSGDLQTTQVFRDPSAWYHIIVAVDTTQATAANRVKVYINGTQVTAFSTASYPSQNYDTQINSAVLHTVGAFYNGGTPVEFFDGYMTEINFIDGQALTPSSFGETNAITGVWQPKKYAGTYGTNGFYLNFSDNSTAAALGTDFSGNSNTWTVNNISVTAGATYDSMIDVPTPYADGGNGRGNYAVLNPLDDNTNMAPSSGNLDWVNAGATQYSTKSTIFPTSGKWYAEFTISSSAAIIAIANQNAVVQGVNGINGVFALTTFIYNNSGTAAQSGLASFAASDVIAVAYDADTNSVQFYRNNSTYGTAVTPSATGPFCFYVGANGATCTVNANFGQRPFSYTPPSGFVALNTQNLPEPTISNGASYMAATTYTGNNGTQSVNNAVNNVSFQPDFVWVKNRTNAFTHLLYDSVRGVGTLKAISSSETTAEGGMSDNSTFGYLSALNSNGFTVVSGSTANSYTNSSSNNYIGWQWNAGGSTVTNTDGTISAQVRANPTAGFSVVTYTGNGSSSATVGHGLGVTPSMIIVKARSGGSDWETFHTSLGASFGIRLNTTAAKVAASSTAGGIISTSPTSTTFGFTAGTSNVNNANQSGLTFVAYCFAPVAGYSAFGSYTGNGSADGPFVFTGFRPRFVMWKSSSNAGTEWVMYDTSRSTYNVMGEYLLANQSSAGASNSGVDFLSNGFKLKLAGGGSTNASSYTYIYMAFAENPFKLSLAR